MGLSIGIVGLPNVGKSTAFNALTKTQNAQVANYPFCTIKPNHAIVPLPDERLEKLQKLLGVPNRIHATVEFVDIAGLVKGASQGEGLGNQFLATIRDTDAIVHVVRCFDDPNVVHISEMPEPREDIEIINVELMMADLQQVERKIERLISQVKGDRKLLPMLETARSLQDHLARGNPVSTFPNQDNDHLRALAQELRFLTSKPVIYAANVDESGLAEEVAYVQAVREKAAEHGAKVVLFSAKLEEDMIDMGDDERQEYLELAGAEASGLEQIIQKSFDLLELISFFTKNENEVRAWNVSEGTVAPKAAGVIHTDFERGFIRAEVVPYAIYTQYGSDSAVKAVGLMRLEGKEYIVQDGDIIYFRFNV
jgi:GTP-binding protein YchF